MSRKSLFETPLTAKERAMRSNAKLKKAGGEVITLRLDKGSIEALNYLVRAMDSPNRADCIRKALQAHCANTKYARGEFNA